MRIVCKILNKGDGQTAFLNSCFRLIHACKGKQIFASPVLAVQLLHCSVGQQIDRRFKEIQRAAFKGGGNPKGIVLVAAVCVPDKVRADTAQIGIAWLAATILSDKYDIVIGIAFIQPSRTDTEIYQVVVNTSSMQIFDGVGGTAVWFWQKQNLFFLFARFWVKVGGDTATFPIIVSTACIKGISLTLIR